MDKQCYESKAGTTEESFHQLSCFCELTMCLPGVMIYFILCKAFDTVLHNITVSILEEQGLDGRDHSEDQELAE